MATNTNNLEPESLLMLYAADELPADERRRVDEMLASDPAMRGKLDELLSAQKVMVARFEAADATTRLPAPLSSSVRNVSRAIQQWHVDRLAKPAAPLRERRKFGWLYATAGVAAAIVITVFVLWSRVDDGKNDQIADLVHKLEQEQQQDAKNNTTANNTSASDTTANDTTANDTTANDTTVVADATPAPAPAPPAPSPEDQVADYTPAGGESDRQLSRAEGDMYTLTALTDSLHPSDDTVTTP